MDMKKIGNFLKELRKEKELTQEQLAEIFNVSRRTVSRWETGNNIPDLDILIELSDYYHVDLREILDGERKDLSVVNHNDTVKKVVELSCDQKEKLRIRMHIICIINLILVSNNNTNHFLGGFCQGTMLGYMIIGCIMTSKYANKITLYKMNFTRE